jgi:hypothetical protein
MLFQIMLQKCNRLCSVGASLKWSALIDSDSVLGVRGNKWIACLRDLPDNPRAAAESEQVSVLCYLRFMNV